jgi:hypothetical protein
VTPVILTASACESTSSRHGRTGSIAEAAVAGPTVFDKRPRMDRAKAQRARAMRERHAQGCVARRRSSEDGNAVTGIDCARLLPIRSRVHRPHAGSENMMPESRRGATGSRCTQARRKFIKLHWSIRRSHAQLSARCRQCHATCVRSWLASCSHALVTCSCRSMTSLGRRVSRHMPHMASAKRPSIQTLAPCGAQHQQFITILYYIAACYAAAQDAGHEGRPFMNRSSLIHCKTPQPSKD